MCTNGHISHWTGGTHDAKVNCGTAQSMCPMDSIYMTCLSSDSYVAWRLPDGSIILFDEQNHAEITHGVFTATLTDAPYASSNDEKLSILEFPALPNLEGTSIQISVSDSSISDLEVVGICTIAVQGTCIY